MATDAVQAAVIQMRELVEKLKTSERFFDQDALIDSAEQTVIGLSHLRTGAGQVQTNLEELEQKVKAELVQGIGARMIDGESKIAMIEQKMNAIEGMIIGMNGAGMSFGGGSGGGGKGGYRSRGVLEYKAMQFMKPLTGDKTGFRQWHQKFVSAAYTVQEEFGDMIRSIAADLDTGSKVDEIRQKLEEKYGDEFMDEWSAKLYTVLMDKSEGEAYDKIKGVSGRDGVEGYAKVYQWFTEISGLGLAEQARRLMHPEPPKTEEKLAEYVDAWCEGNRRLEAHESRYSLPPRCISLQPCG